MQENKDEIIAVSENSLIGEKQLTPKDFDYLETVLHKMNQYHFRHIVEVSWKWVMFWILCVLVTQAFSTYYISGKSLIDMTLNLTIFSVIFSFICGFFCIASKCLTRLYHFNHIALRLSQSIFILLFIDIVSPFLLILNKIHPGLGNINRFLGLGLIIGIIYFIGYSFAPYKWLRKATIVYSVIITIFILSLFSLSSFTHFIFKDNTVTVYSDLESGNARDLADIDSMIDDIIKK